MYREAKPGSVSKLFSTHPATGDRIKKVETTITNVLPAADRYVENTSEFDQMKSRLAKLQGQRPPEDENRPTLRRRPQTQDDPDQEPQPDDDDRPTLKRKS